MREGESEIHGVREWGGGEERDRQRKSGERQKERESEWGRQR